MTQPVGAVETVRSTGTGSGADVQVSIAFACILEEGELLRVEEYLNLREALESVGLER
jgi:hypothetical protein